MGKITTENRPFLSFSLDKDYYALDIHKTREVLKFSKITHIPKTPDYMLGVINLRGSAVAVADLKMKFGMGKIENPGMANIIILELKHENETLQTGILVDAVHEVLELDLNQIEGAPRLGVNTNTGFIQGIGKKDDEFLIILDIEKIFSVTELTLVSSLKNSNFQDSLPG